MLTRAGGSNPRRRRDPAAGTIKLLEKRIDTMEIKEELSKADVQSILRTSKLTGDVSNDIKEFHFAIVDQLENGEDAETEQETLDQHELKVIELVDCIAELVEEPSRAKKCSDKVMNPGDADEATMKGQVIDRQLDILDGSVTAIKGSVEANTRPQQLRRKDQEPRGKTGRT